MAKKRVMTPYYWRLMIKFLVIVVPSFSVAVITVEMVYTIPMLASATFLASHLFEDEHPKPTPGQDALIDEEIEDVEFYDG